MTHRKCVKARTRADAYMRSSTTRSCSLIFSSLPVHAAVTPVLWYLKVVNSAGQRQLHGDALIMALYHQQQQPEPTDEERVKLRNLRKRRHDLVSEIEKIQGEMRQVDEELEQLSYVDPTSKSRHKMLFQARKKFNEDPQKGIDFLIRHSLLDSTPSAIAAYMMRERGLRKESIGTILGGHEPFHLQILDSFVHQQPLHRVDAVDALREFLLTFKLPGESQKIDRILMAFARGFNDVNPGVFKGGADAIHTLCYSCVMLNTLLHNPNVKEKPSLDRFLEMSKDEMEKSSISRACMESIYAAIRDRPFELPHDESSHLPDLFLNPEQEGWLYKQSSKQFMSGPLSWKRRWFVLSEACLYYFDSNEEREPRGIIPLQNVGVRLLENPSRPHMFEIYPLKNEKVKACKAETDGRLVEGRHTVYRVCAVTDQDARNWVRAIADAIAHHPLLRTAHSASILSN